MSYTDTLRIGAHAKKPGIQLARDTAQLTGLTAIWHAIRWAKARVWREMKWIHAHLFGVVVAAVASVLIAGVGALFVLGVLIVARVAYKMGRTR